MVRASRVYMQIYLERPVVGTNLIAPILPGLYVRKNCHGLCTENLAQDLQLIGLCETGNADLSCNTCRQQWLYQEAIQILISSLLCNSQNNANKNPQKSFSFNQHTFDPGIQIMHRKQVYSSTCLFRIILAPGFQVHLWNIFDQLIFWDTTCSP